MYIIFEEGTETDLDPTHEPSGASGARVRVFRPSDPYCWLHPMPEYRKQGVQHQAKRSP